ncbi:MAG: tetratricopeptide repeat protein [Marinilabiliaceae bacterium]|nr:tetratricopeptide repeat protein [Marinilabiliaceae bacterium]
MPDNPKIFIAYCRDNKNKADEIDNDFKKVGISLTRDIRDAEQKTNLKEYLSSVRVQDYMLMLISDSFLKSVSCMFELLEVFKEKGFKNRILQIILGNADIFTLKGKLSYIQFWENEYAELSILARNSSPKNLGAITNKLKELDFLCKQIGEFLEFLSNELSVSFPLLKMKNYKHILDFVDYSDSSKKEELLRITSIEDEEVQDIAIEEYIETYPDHADGYFVKGYIDYDRKKYLKSIRSYTKALEINPKDSQVYYRRGNVYRAKGEIDKAIGDYSKVLEINSKDSQAYYSRGNAFKAKEEIENAIDDYTRALEINPIDVRAYNSRGNAFMVKGEMENAIEDYTRALEINSKNSEVYFNRGNAFKAKGELEKAIGDYTKALELNPENVDAYYHRGNIFSAKGVLEKAIADYTIALEINPKFTPAYYCRGLAFRSKGEKEKARHDRKKYVMLKGAK